MRNQQKSMISRCSFWLENENGDLTILYTPRSSPREGVGEGINPYPSEGIHWIWLIWLNLVNWIMGNGTTGVGFARRSAEVTTTWTAYRPKGLAGFAPSQAISKFASSVRNTGSSCSDPVSTPLKSVNIY